MEYTVKLTPEMRTRILHAETLTLDIPEEDDLKATGKNISDLITASGISCEVLAEQSGYGRTTLRHWKTGRCRISLVSAADILKLLGYELVIKKVNEDD